MLWSYNLYSIYLATYYLNVIMLIRSLTHIFLLVKSYYFYELFSQGVIMHNMGSSSFIMKYIIINVYVHNYSKNCLFTWIELVIITIQKGRHLKAVVTSCQPLNSLMNITFVAFLVLVISIIFIGNIRKEIYVNCHLWMFIQLKSS